MNAEFTEQKIIITVKNVEGKYVATITPAKVRKGLDTNAFIGAMVCVPGLYSSIIHYAVNDQYHGKIDLHLSGVNTGELIQYDPATGEFTYVTANNSNP